MYFGSVRFFKHLFLTILILLILVPTCLAIFFGVAYRQKDRDLDDAYAEIDRIRTVVQCDEIDEELDEKSVIDAVGEISAGSEYLYDYQNLYPELYVDRAAEYTADDKTVYLTFDDGPSDRTAEILDILAEKNVKATFFTVYQGSDQARELMRRVVAEGHTIAVHSYSHRYSEIYSSVEAFLSDFYQQWSYIRETTGVTPTVFRFPGGSINGYNGNLYQEIIAEMTRRGFLYYDWNTGSGDAGTVASTKEEILSAVVTQAQGKNRAVVLMHDSQNKQTTVAALGEIIDQLREAGYSFQRITNEVRPVIMPYRDYQG